MLPTTRTDAFLWRPLQILDLFFGEQSAKAEAAGLHGACS